MNIKLTNENKGITLVALVITVILLLIIAGVSLTLITGDGYIGQTHVTRDKYVNAQENEVNTINELLGKGANAFTFLNSSEW